MPEIHQSVSFEIWCKDVMYHLGASMNVSSLEKALSLSGLRLSDFYRGFRYNFEPDVFSQVLLYHIFSLQARSRQSKIPLFFRTMGDPKFSDFYARVTNRLSKPESLFDVVYACYRAGFSEDRVRTLLLGIPEYMAPEDRLYPVRVTKTN